MPFCRCGELCSNDKCKKCGFNMQLNGNTSRRNSSVDRWQSSRYLGSVMGLDNLSSEEQDSRSACSPLSQRATSPILKRISKPFNSLLDSRKVGPSKTNGSASPRRFSTSITENNCGDCNKKLSGKTVRLPDAQVRYHWKCLKCKNCALPFEDTSFYIDSNKRVFHPKCAPSTPVAQNCSRCSQDIKESYILSNSLVLHPRCFRCTGCQKILHPTSIYTEMNGSFCQDCTEEKLTNDKETLAKHMKIVPQPQLVAMISPSSAPKLDISALTQGVMSCSISPSVEKTISSPLLTSHLPTDTSNESIKPSSLMSSRGRPLPRFGVVRDCPGCSERIVSVHEEIPGPKAARWHKKCLACNGCSKILDSGATVHEEEGTGNLKPWCTTCLLNKKKSRNSFFSPASSITNLSFITRYMCPLPLSSLYSPPPYAKPSNDTEITQIVANSDITNDDIEINYQINKQNRHHHHHHHRICHICKRKHTPLAVQDIGPYLIHRTKPDLITICPCSNKAHPICLKNYGTDYICDMCNYIYKSRRNISVFAQLLCFTCHLLSLASTVGLVFGLSQLGKALDELGLGSEYGPKLDGDETWQDHEMAEILEWLNIVHFTTGIAGEALLGLVYIVGVCLVIGVDKTLTMISNILYIQLDWRQKQTNQWVNKIGICVFLFLLGLVLGTYLLFFSWIWASVLHHVRKRVLDVKTQKKNNNNEKGRNTSTSTQPRIPLTTIA